MYVPTLADYLKVMAPRKSTKSTTKASSKKVAKTPAQPVKKVVKTSKFREALSRVSPTKSTLPKFNRESARNFLRTRTKVKIASAVVIILIAAGLVIFGNRLIDGIQRQFGVAVVNGQLISKSELDHRLVQSYGSDMTSSLVDETLVLQEGNKEKVTIAQKDIDGQISKIESQIAPQKLDDALAQRHLTRDDLNRQIRIQLIVEKILGKDIHPSNTDIQNYFDQNKDTLAQQANKTADQLKIEDVRDAIISNLISSQISAKYQPWIESLRAKASIKTFI